MAASRRTDKVVLEFFKLQEAKKIAFDR